jgi:hypothetical protein
MKLNADGVDILFIHIHISIHLGADLTVWGPDAFGGYAWVDFWFFGFGIEFGDAEKNISAAMPLEEFYKQALNVGPASTPPLNDKVGTGALTEQHKYSVEEGLFPAKAPDADADKSFPSTGAQSVWQVKAGTLKFRIDTPFALSGAHFASSDSHDSTAILIPSSKPNKPDEHPDVPKVYSWPMHSKKENNITSSLEISVFQIDDPEKPVLQHGFRGELVVKSAPVSVWSIYDWRKDPLLVNQPGHLRNADASTTNLVLGVRILPPLPHLYPSRIVDFDASAAMRETIPGSYAIPLAETDQETSFSGGYYRPEVADDDVVEQVERWAQFGATWSPPPVPVPVPDKTTPAPTTDPPKPMTLSDLRSALVEQIAYTLEWNFRPSEEMAGNISAPSSNATVTTTTTSSSGAALPPGNKGSSSPAGTSPSPQPPAPSTSSPLPLPPSSSFTSVAVMDPATKMLRDAKLAQITADGRFEWILNAEPPVMLAREVDVYYPQLPFVVGAFA